MMAILAAWGWTTDTGDKLAELHTVRHSLLHWLEHLPGLDDLDALVLVASELTTNAIQATTTPSDAIALQVRIEGDRVVLQVANVGSAFVVQAELRDRTAAAGRGLLIVRSLTDGVQVSQEGRNVVVSAWRRLATAC